MNCWSITTFTFEGAVPNTLGEKERFWFVCELKRNDKLMLRRVVPEDIVAEIIPAMHMIAQGLAVLEINPRHVVDLDLERDNTLLFTLDEKFGASPSVEFICKTVDQIIERGNPKPKDDGS